MSKIKRMETPAPKAVKEKSVKQTELIRLIKPLLGIPAGSVFVYDKHTGRFIYSVVEEDISEDSYEYSSNILDLDPSLVEANMGEFFELFEGEKTKDEVKSKEVDVEKVKEDTKVHLEESDFENGKDEPALKDEVESEEVPENKLNPDEGDIEFVEGTEGDLVITCGKCGHETFVDHMTRDFIVALPINNYAAVDLKCEECGAELKLHYTNIMSANKESDESEVKGDA